MTHPTLTNLKITRLQQSPVGLPRIQIIFLRDGTYLIVNTVRIHYAQLGGKNYKGVELKTLIFRCIPKGKLRKTSRHVASESDILGWQEQSVKIRIKLTNIYWAHQTTSIVTINRLLHITSILITSFLSLTILLYIYPYSFFPIPYHSTIHLSLFIPSYPLPFYCTFRPSIFLPFNPTPSFISVTFPSKFLPFPFIFIIPHFPTLSHTILPPLSFPILHKESAINSEPIFFPKPMRK